jgi:hypothetical protein
MPAASGVSRRPDRSLWLAWPAALLALFLLNGSLTFTNVWPTPKVRWGWALSVELALVVLAMAVASRWAPRLARGVLPGLWVVLVIGRYLAVTGPGLYGREFNLYWDAPHIGNVVAMLAKAVPPWALGAGLAGAVLALVAAFVAARVALGQIARLATSRTPRLVLAALALMVVSAFALQPGTAKGARAEGLFASPVTPTYVSQAGYVLALAVPGPTLGPSPEALNSELRALHGADVLVVFVESYGAVTYDNPTFAAALAASRSDLEAAARETGRHLVSAYIDPPTFGASSWLSHLTLMTGVEVRDQYAYSTLMTSSRDTLPRAFRRRGYRSVALMPGMRQLWPEGVFYGFDEIYGRSLLAYPGPQFGWWGIPDQFALARLDELERARGDRAPLFAVFPTSTTHAPFGPVPPYQAEWSRVLTAEPFDPEETAAALARWPDLTNLGPSYVRATAYEFVTFAGYLREHATDDMVVILIGDHQPPSAVSGPGAPWEVPLHVIARQTPVIEHLLARGFTPGISPRRPALAPLHALVPILMKAFDVVPGVQDVPLDALSPLDPLNE